jgi:hypothetical protein
MSGQFNEKIYVQRRFDVMLFFFSTCRKKVLSRLVKKQILQLDLIWRNKSLPCSSAILSMRR